MDVSLLFWPLVAFVCTSHLLNEKCRVEFLSWVETLNVWETIAYLSFSYLWSDTFSRPNRRFNLVVRMIFMYVEFVHVQLVQSDVTTGTSQNRESQIPYVQFWRFISPTVWCNHLLWSRDYLLCWSDECLSQCTDHRCFFKKYKSDTLSSVHIYFVHTDLIPNWTFGSLIWLFCGATRDESDV